ncbi:hypothetical protein J6590_074794 [Homalodisca vitripennis]|nr:hypothetical protein J6590_074794 [Homalodisca vitripennis]
MWRSRQYLSYDHPSWKRGGEVRAKTKSSLTLNLGTNGLKATQNQPQWPCRRATCKDRIAQRPPTKAAAMLDVA